MYEDRNEVFPDRTLRGTKKQKLTPEKLKNIKDIFLERIDSEKEDFGSKETRYKSFNRYVTNTIVELSNEYTAEIKKNLSVGVLNLPNIDSTSVNQNDPVSQHIETVQNSHIDINQNILYCTPVTSFTLTPNGYLVNNFAK